MAYMGTTINQSPTIAGTLGADIAGDASCLAVKCDDNGNFIKTGDGEHITYQRPSALSFPDTQTT